LPDSGASPPPFTEKVPTFQTRVVGQKVLVHPCPHAPGTWLEPALIEPSRARPIPMNGEFYVGYLPNAPASLARWVARVVTAIVLGGAAVGALLIFDQPPFAASKFEYGVYREYSGIIEERPYPTLRTPVASFLLVAPGKHGLSDAVRGLQGR